MVMMDLQITVDFDKAAEHAGRSVDIGQLLRLVPSAAIVEGNPHVSVRVEVPERDHERLMAVVADLCVVNPFRMLELYGSADPAWSGMGIH